MTWSIGGVLVAAVITPGAMDAMAIEEAAYAVAAKDGIQQALPLHLRRQSLAREDCNDGPVVPRPVTRLGLPLGAPVVLPARAAGGGQCPLVGRRENADTVLRLEVILEVHLFRSWLESLFPAS